MYERGRNFNPLYMNVTREWLLVSEILVFETWIYRYNHFIQGSQKFDKNTKRC